MYGTNNSVTMRKPQAHSVWVACICEGWLLSNPMTWSEHKTNISSYSMQPNTLATWPVSSEIS